MPRHESFAALLGRALDALAREAPGAYSRLAEATGADGVRLAIDAAPVVLRFDPLSRPRHALSDGAAPVDVRADRETVLALADGRLSLVGALESERLWIQGTPDAVLRFDAALSAFLDGAVRSPSVAPLLDSFRSGGRSAGED